MRQQLTSREDVYRVALADFGQELPALYLRAKLKIRRLTKYGSDEEIGQVANGIEAMFAANHEPQMEFGDGSLLPQLEALLQLLIKYLPLILKILGL